MQEIDRIAEANAHLDRRARQRAAKAAALLELTPEAIKLEEERQRVNAALLSGGEAPPNEWSPPAVEAVLEDPHEEPDSPIGRHGERHARRMQDPEYAEAYDEAVASFANEGNTPQTLDEKLAEALQPVVDRPAEDEPEIIAIGRAMFQWILVPSPEAVDDQGFLIQSYQLALQLQVDEQPPGGFAAEITQEQLDSWNTGKGLQGNRIEHKQFVSALFERFLAVGLNETGNALVYALEQLMYEGYKRSLDPPTVLDMTNPEAPFKRAYEPPTETAVGDADEPELPELSD